MERNSAGPSLVKLMVLAKAFLKGKCYVKGYCPKSCVNSLAIKLLWLILLITSEFNKKEGG